MKNPDNWQDAARVYERQLARELDDILEERERESEEEELDEEAEFTAGQD